MRPVSIKLKDMAIANIQLGFVGENNATQVIFECKEIFDENPYAVQLLVVTPPEGTSYEVTTARIGDNVIWNVSELDTAFEGDGSIQLVFTDGSQVIKTYNADTTVLESQVPSGTAPATALNWIQDAEAWAKGTRGGRAVEDDDPTYQNNSKYYSDKIVNMASDSEAWAKGTRDGEAVESDDPAYHNNSKYYAESIADTASDSEAYAAGTRGGEDVDEDDPAYENNAKYYNEQAALEKAAAQAAAETASAAYNVNLLAANYDATKTYAVGEYVIYNGGLYRCISAITTAEAWTAAHWSSVTVGKDTSALKGAIKDEDTRTNQILSFVNYGYDDPINYPIGDGSTWGKSIGIYRDGTTVKIHKPSSTTVDIRAKLSGAFALAANNSGVNAWTSGLTFKTGHQYKITSRLIGGSAVSGSDSNYGGAVSVYPTGTSTSVGTATTGNGVNSRILTAEENTAYNIVFYATKAAIFTNAVYLITMEDLTESEFVNLQKQIDEIKVNTEYTDIKLKSGNITDAGKAGSNNEYIRTYTGELPKIEKGDIISAENGFELVNVHIFNKNSVSSVAHVIKLTVSDANHFAIPDTYVGMYVGFTVYEPSKTGTDISGDLTAAMNSVKIAKEVSLAETIGNLNSRVDALETGESIPDYYFDDDYLDDKVTDINTIGVGIGVKALRTVFITDYHYEDNARKSPALIEYLMQKTGIRSVVFGGDAMNHDYASKVGGYNKICTFLDDFKKIREWANMFLITGNHEMNNADLAHDSVELPKSVPYSLFNEPIFYKIKPLWASGKNTNSFYVDDDVAKIRFYGIDCTSGASIQKAYLDVILPSFLTVPEGYAVVVFSHSGIESYTSDGETPPTYTITALTTGLDAIMQAGKAMNDGANATISVTIGGTVYTWNLDFTGKARTFVGAIIGHSHLDSYYIYDSRFPVIAVLCDTGAYRDTHPARVAGTITEQAFDVIQIDIATSRIYCTRIGYGSDRTFSFGEDAGIVT